LYYNLQYLGKRLLTKICCVILVKIYWCRYLVVRKINNLARIRALRYTRRILKSPSRIRQSIDSMASSSSTTSCSFSKNEAASRSLSNRSATGGIRHRFSSCSVYRYHSATLRSNQDVQNLSQDNTGSSWAKEHTQSRQESSLAEDHGNYLMNNFLTVIFSQFVLCVLGFAKPEILFIVDILTSMILRYRDQYCLKQHYATIALATNASLSSLQRRTSSCTSSRAFHQGPAGLISPCSCDEFHAQAKSITSPGEEEHDDGWGHFTDFECFDEDNYERWAVFG